MRRWNRKVWLVGGCVTGIAFCAALALQSLPASENGGTERTRTEQAEDGEAARPVANEAVWEEALLWSEASGAFSSHADTPVVVLRTDDLMLFVRNGELRYARKGADQGVLMHFPEKLQVTRWPGDRGLLLGGTPEAAPAAGQTLIHSWTYIPLPLEKENPAASVRTMGPTDFAPAEAVRVRAIENPLRLLIQTRSSGERNEYMLTPGSDTVRYVSSILPPERDLPDRIVPQTHDDRITPLVPDRSISGPAQPIYSFRSEDGTLLYQTEPSESAAFYPGLAYDSSVRVAAEKAGEERFAVLLKSDAGATYMASPGESWLYPWHAELSTPGWVALNKHSLYRLTESRLETAAYRFVRGGAELHMSALPLEDLTYVGRTGTRLEFAGTKDGGGVFLSLHDLSNLQTPEPRTADLSIRAQLDGVPIPSEPAAPAPYFEERRVPFSKFDPDRWPSTLPAGLTEELDKLRDMGSGDAMSSTTFYEHSGTWYVLEYDRLSRFVPEREPLKRLEFVARLPVGVSCSVSNYSVCRTAERFLQASGHWFVADTYKDRLLKLNDRFEIVGETNVPLPTSVLLDEGGGLSVEALDGTYRFDLELRLDGKRERGFTAVPAGSDTVASLFPSAYWEDASTGLLWYYESGYLHQYRSDTKTVRSTYAGHLENARGAFRIVPYRDRVLAFSDHLLLQFRRADGRFLRAFRFDRAEPDGIYDTSPTGENSFVLDQQKSRLYLVQGYRILDIDLESGTVRELFRQDHAELGRIVLDRDRLLFTLQPGGRWAGMQHDDPGLANELIRLDLGTGRTARYGIPDSYYSGRISGDGLILSLFEPAGSGRAPELRIPLDRLELR
ncbi:hypothetical protein [Paenibacillus flagellatus]|uniref:Uncharacterized protein n=1 Tax=Paenibacillus flagellatus TaxID=2211139 RepID=A0A2V5KCW0_9BACL|nr:hypothetical protein [Paenibacillus flagellatus]PYI57388.1 hypothetical protein DLM86_02825 [Paenibacillus flagellatus]